MKIESLLGLIVAITCTATAVAQQPGAARPVNHSLSLEVIPQKSGGASHLATVEEAASHHLRMNPKVENMTITTFQQVLQVSVRNLGSVPDTATLEYWFFGGHHGDVTKNDPDHPKVIGTTDFLYDHQSKPLTLPAGQTTVVPVASKELYTYLLKRNSEVSGNVTTIYYNYETGSKPRGWMVRVVADGKVLAVRGSSNSYEELGKDDTKLRTMEEK